MNPFNFPTYDESNLLDEVLDENTGLVFENTELKAQVEFLTISYNSLLSTFRDAVALMEEQEANIAKLNQDAEERIKRHVFQCQELIEEIEYLQAEDAMDSETVTENIDALYDCVSSLSRRVHELETKSRD